MVLAASFEVAICDRSIVRANSNHASDGVVGQEGSKIIRLIRFFCSAAAICYR